ncbi:MAG TPA: 2-dehydropantoate 2-reductase [Opitutaceae bacterium]|jgi:2-dehydropantoate 2-reductase|nr:2-dehydropantoate 2-reductase [Opitutaceae bacterium]
MAESFARIGIVGSGAVGSYYGTRLGLAGLDVRFLMRGDLRAVRSRGSMLVHDSHGSAELKPVAAFGSAAEMGQVDLVIMSLKTTSSEAVEGLVAPLLGPGTAILTLQNGLGADEYLGHLFGNERILGGLVFMAINRMGPGEVRTFNPGMVSIGELGRPATARTHALSGLLNKARINSQVVENLLEARWQKLMWNIPFNGLSIAEGGITTDRICADPRIRADARALMLEIQKAAAAFGFTLSDEFLERQFTRTVPMGPYKPSSLVDYLAGKDVEIEPIWGEPLRRAQAAGVAMPALERLHERIIGRCRAGYQPPVP